MSADGVTLLDLITRYHIHALQPNELVRTGAATLKQLRLVSKEMGAAALMFVRQCEVYLGEGTACPTPQQLVRLMGASQEQLKLEWLKVTVTVTSGPTAATLVDQLTDCVVQMDCLLKGLGKVIANITTLTLKVVHRERESRPAQARDHEVCGFSGKSEQQQQQQLQQQQEEVEVEEAEEHMENPRRDTSTSSISEPQLASSDTREHPMLETPCPGGLGVATGSVVEMLAEAVPALQTLWMAGFCGTASLNAFSALCPQLQTLYVDAIKVPVAELHDISYLPDLAWVIVSDNHSGHVDEEQLGEYMDALLHALRDCPKLEALSIFLSEGSVLACQPRSWEQLPESLHCFECNCPVVDSSHYKKFIQGLSSLELLASPCEDIVMLLENFPELQSLRVTGAEALHMVCPSGNEHQAGLALLKGRFLDDLFYLDCAEMLLIGTSMEMRSVLACLPPLPSVESLTLRFTENTVLRIDCLEMLPHVFPDLMLLSLDSQSSETGTSQDLDMTFFAPLERCLNLESLSIFTGLNLTSADLLKLCSSLQQLTQLSYMACMGVDSDKLMTMMQEMGRDILVEPVSV